MRLGDDRTEARIEHDGYAIIPGFIDPEGVRRLTELFVALPSPVHDRPFAASMMSEDTAYRAAVDQGIKQVFAPGVAKHLGGYRHCFSNYLVKAQAPPGEPGTGEVGLHQDNQMVDEERSRTLGLWVPLIDTNEENGCFHVVPGSHRLLPGHRWVYGPFAGSALQEELRARLVPLPLSAGDAILFSQALVHASPPNRTPTPRVAAGALLAPEGEPLLCYYRDPQTPDRLEIYAVDDLFYSRYLYRGRPEGVPLAAVVPVRQQRVDQAVLAELSRAAPRCAAGRGDRAARPG